MDMGEEFINILVIKISEKKYNKKILCFWQKWFTLNCATPDLFDDKATVGFSFQTLFLNGFAESRGIE